MKKLCSNNMRYAKVHIESFQTLLIDCTLNMYSRICKMIHGQLHIYKYLVHCKSRGVAGNTHNK